LKLTVAVSTAAPSTSPAIRAITEEEEVQRVEEQAVTPARTLADVCMVPNPDPDKARASRRSGEGATFMTAVVFGVGLPSRTNMDAFSTKGASKEYMFEPLPLLRPIVTRAERKRPDDCIDGCALTMVSEIHVVDAEAEPPSLDRQLRSTPPKPAAVILNASAETFREVAVGPLHPGPSGPVFDTPPKMLGASNEKPGAENPSRPGPSGSKD